MSFRDSRTAVFSVVIAAILAISIPVGLFTEQEREAVLMADPAVLRIGFLEPIDSLNPYVGLTETSSIFYGLVYDALTCIGNDTQIVPNLAKEWWAVPVTDPEMVAFGYPFGSVWQYNLSTNTVWTDGEPFDADDVVFNINLNAQNYETMWGYQPYAYFIEDATKIDDSTVRIHFWDRLSGDPVAVSYGASLSVHMLPEHMLSGMSPAELSFVWPGYYSESESPGMPIVGTGPFQVTQNLSGEWLAGDHITLVRNPNCHWSSDYNQLIRYDQIVLQFYDDPYSLTAALVGGSIDAASLPQDRYLWLEQEIGLGNVQNVTLFSGPKVTQHFTEVMFNMNNAGPNPSRLDPVVRQALHMATNKSYIVEQFYSGLADEGSTLIPPVNSYWHYEPNVTEKFQYNLTAAAELLEANGYVDANSDNIRECTASSFAVQEGYVNVGTPLSYEMLTRNSHPEENDIAQFLESEWYAIGVNLDRVVITELMLMTYVYSYNYDTAIWYWTGDIDPNFQLFMESREAWYGWSENKYYNASYEENYTLQVQAMDPSARKSHVDNCQKIHYLDSAYIILAYPYQTYAWRTDNFTEWGDWAADPGRSLDNYWTGNPLFFDLTPLYGGPLNDAPRIDSLTVNPNPVLANESAELVVTATDFDADALTFYIDFGDGTDAVAYGSNTTYPQAVNFSHSYEMEGVFNITIWANDSYVGEDHNTTRTYESRVFVGPPGSLVATIDPDPVMLAVRDSVSLAANLTWAGQPIDLPGVTRYTWYVDPMTAGSFDYRGRQQVNFTAGSSATIGNIMCAIVHYDIFKEAIAPLTVLPPEVARVMIVPASALMECNATKLFRAYAFDVAGYPIDNLSFNWSVEGLAPSEYWLSSATGASVEFAGYVEGTALLNATATTGNATKTGTSNITFVWSLPPRSVDFSWYDMFNVPFEEWWYRRWAVTHVDEPLTDIYPYLYSHYGTVPGSIWYYSSMRLNITGRNMTELNMNERPEFLPTLGTPRGGTADINWSMNYLTSEEVTRYPINISSWNDGWIVCLNGTATLDRDASISVMNLSEAAFDDFPVWWAANQAEFKASYLSWLHYEGNDRLDIYPAYDYPFTVLFFDINATKVGDDIVLRYDIVSWGMEILMTRWMHDAFMPTEWFFENMTFKANITSDMANLDIQTVVAYAVYACETTLVPGGSSTGRGEPCWVWEAMLADYMPSTGIHTHSDFDPYDNKTYVDRSPGSGLYGMIIPYDYTPGAWNLSEGETLTLAWPAGDVQFKRHIAPGSVANETGEMILTAAEPSDSDLPGVVSINDTARTISFSGPVDMWTWSRSQTAHEELASEWSRLGLLPQGVPYLEFKMAMNTPPRAMASLDPTTGDLLTMFEFNASRCYDLEEDAASLMVRWDWDNDGTWDTVWSTDKVEYHQFSATGDYMVMLEVRDGSNVTNLTYVTVHVVDVIPEFSTPLVPILCLMLVVAIVVRLRRRRT